MMSLWRKTDVLQMLEQNLCIQPSANTNAIAYVQSQWLPEDRCGLHLLPSLRPQKHASSDSFEAH